MFWKNWYWIFLILAIRTFSHAGIIPSQNTSTFFCNDGLYINAKNVCDGMPQCKDSSDEAIKNCINNDCPSSSFRCAYGACISRSKRCDGVLNCADGSDEQFCDSSSECSNHEFRCLTSVDCIPSTSICDGSVDCPDGSDESLNLCKDYKCSKHSFQCHIGSCVQSELVCDGISHCVDGSDETAEICNSVACKGDCEKNVCSCNFDEFCCKNGICLPEIYLCDSNNDCSDGSDEDEEICNKDNDYPDDDDSASAIRCQVPSDSRGVLQRCKAKGGPEAAWIPCNQTMPIGTVIYLQCMPFYERDLGSPHVSCLKDGTWSQVPLSCSPICGQKLTATTLIVNGWEASPDDVMPWHAALFSLRKGEYQYFCGGTLISERAVLTAGHCVWKMSKDTLKVLLSSHSSNFSENNEGTIVRSVERIEIQEAYQDREGNYGSDIAIILLEKAVSFGPNVQPACIDWKNELEVYDRIGEHGYVTGMGITENDTVSSVLRITSVPVVSRTICLKKQIRDFRKYLGFTSFCGGWANGTSVCNGDSGGGFLLKRPNSEIWEVHGIVSISPRRFGKLLCDPNNYAIFTRVSIYRDWIKKVLDSSFNVSTVHLFENRSQY